ncbi:MAG: hypothetical protein FJ125_02840 [Deltaproteobacteria bacterium]|nr:hypothetical protein [Deltaproteobacteria bacterium]
MPEELWDAAVSLVGQHGLYRISRDLAVDYGALQTRVAQAMADEEDPGAGLDGFVEVSPGMLERHADLGGAVLELTRADGTRMELRLPAHEAVDVVGLVAAFAGNGA